ncbi:hypothetical protein BU16DRAFT_539026 [Lophium mytilinum]|uniref:Uncharacterized protein n=1 Tax=Lophium mytilinum TaxID=390894 RepID=A0A6A6QWA7_9PEZI|nr:hypothetical protein BU16DRAFT_539026 [Lophium mytilinum]
MALYNATWASLRLPNPRGRGRHAKESAPPFTTIRDVALVICTSHGHTPCFHFRQPRSSLSSSLQPLSSPHTVAMGPPVQHSSTEAADDGGGKEESNNNEKTADKKTEDDQVMDDKTNDGGDSNNVPVEDLYAISLTVADLENPFIHKLQNFRQSLSNHSILEGMAEHYVQEHKDMLARLHTVLNLHPAQVLCDCRPNQGEIIQETRGKVVTGTTKHVETFRHANETLKELRIRLRQDPTNDQKVLSIFVDAMLYGLDLGTISRYTFEKDVLALAAKGPILPNLDAISFRYLCSITTAEDLLVAVVKLLESILTHYRLCSFCRALIHHCVQKGISAAGSRYHLKVFQSLSEHVDARDF